MNTTTTEVDSEIENVLLSTPCLNRVELDKPLSPILNSSINRKFFGRKNNNKSRIKLSKRFESEKKEEKCVNKQIQEFNEDSFSLSLTDDPDLVNCLEKLEEIEKNREVAYKVLINNRKSNLCFKKPTSPAPKTPRRLKHHTHNPLPHQEEEIVLKKNEAFCERIFLSQNKPIDLPTTSNFQTGTGKNIQITSENLQKHSNLFKDILTCSQTEYNRQNKYSFLRKTQHTQSIEACRRDLNKSNPLVHDNREISLTQAIGDSGISDTQMLFAVDNVLNCIANISSENKEFSGFSSAEISESVFLRDKFKPIIYKNKTILSKKRPIQEEYFPFNKKLKTDSKSFSSSVGKFSMASGNKIKIASDSIDKAVDIFGKMDSELKSPNNANSVNFWPKSEQKLDLQNSNDIVSGIKSKYNTVKNKLQFFDNFIGVGTSEDSHQTQSENILPKKVKLETNFHPVNSNFRQYSKASEKHINKAQMLFQDIDFTDLKKLENSKFGGFHTASYQNISSNSLHKTKSLFENEEKDFKNSRPQEKDADFQKSDLPVEKLSSFHQIVGDDSNNNNSMPPKFLAKSDNAQNIPETKNSESRSSVKDKLKYFDQLIGDDCAFVPRVDLNVPNSINLQSIKPAPVSKQKLEFFDNVLGNNNLSVRSNSFQSLKIPENFGKFSNASGKSLQPSNSALKKASAIFDDILDKYPTTSTSFTTPVKNLNDSSAKKSKRKLGVSSLKQIPIPESKLQKAKLLFDEDFTGISPIKPLVPNFTNNFQRFNSCSTPIRNELPTYESFTDVNDSAATEKLAVDPQLDDINLADDCVVTFDTSEPKGAAQLVEDFENEVKNLEERLIVIKKRQQVMETLKKEKPDCDKKPIQGVLHRYKKNKSRLSLSCYVNGEKPGRKHEDNLFCITPQNAGDIHFKESSATITTEDGATVVPNIKNLIGLSEIEIAFKAMRGVDPRLIPKDWIKNHYKWIIWKLTSYERMFPDSFKGSLTVEHVIQQLKYRYDREIDKAERSALRKILEKDDAPQKRIVLCVSDIKKVEDAFELELSDGWYGVRTVIDEPLSQQILTKRIKIGTKLISCGAELMQCDGCHPLDVTDLTFLKINFNCTRRAKWDTRLGYQKFPGPFPVPLHTVHPNGGIIGCIDVCIVRSYPFRYLDKSEIKSVWRNAKAEERTAQNWENDRYKKLEEIEEHVRKELSSTYKQENLNKENRNNVADISEITCPKTLLEIIDASNDPHSIEIMRGKILTSQAQELVLNLYEYFELEKRNGGPLEPLFSVKEEKLTSSQKCSLLEYKRNVFLQKQQEMAVKVKDTVEKLKITQREVVPVMKLLVVDLNGSPTKAFNFFIWKPSESHVQTLKEETCLTVFYIYPKINGDLYSGTKTMFKQKSNGYHMSQIFRRKLVAIADLNDLKFSKNFNEFDTIGIVVQILVDIDTQEVWICDISGRLLLIKIFEGPSTCLLLDNLKRGQVISACNLVYRGLSDELMICRASAGHFTVFSSYPRHKHLQSGLEDLKRELPKEFDKVLQDCDSRIEKFKLKKMSKMLDESDEDSTLISSRITSTDIALSLIDMDKFI